MMKLYSTIVLLFFGTLVFAQTEKFTVADISTSEPIPFAKVYPDVGQPVLADIDGQVTFDLSKVKQVRINATNYHDTAIVLENCDRNFLFITTELQEVNEVTVVPGENPAHRIMDLAIANRKKNNPNSNDAYRYDSYSKFIAQVDPEVLNKIPADTKDTSLINSRNFINRSHLLMIESNTTKASFLLIEKRKS